MNIFVRSFDMFSLQSTLFAHERLLHTFLRRKYFVICASVISLLCGPRRAFHTGSLSSPGPLKLVDVRKYQI